MKKILLNISLALALGFSISSCNDWLDGVEQTSTVSDEIVWQDEAYVDKYVNAFYTYLNKYGQFGEAQFSGSLTESLTETFKYGSVALGDRAGRMPLQHLGSGFGLWQYPSDDSVSGYAEEILYIPG